MLSSGDSNATGSDLSAHARKPWSPLAGRRWLRRGLAFFAVLVAAFLLVRFVDLHATVRSLEQVDLVAIAASAAIALVERFTMAFKWNLLLRVRGIGLDVGSAFRIYLASTMVGYLLPSTLGGDAFRAVRVSLAGSRVSKVSASILLERVLGLLAMLTLGLLGLGQLVLSGRHDLTSLFVLVACGWLAGFLAMLASMSERAFRLVRRVTARHLSRRIVTVLYSMHDEYLAMSRALGTVVAFFLLSLVNQIVQVLAYVPILLSIGAPVEPIALLALIPLNKAVFQVTPLPAGIGVAEGTIVVTLSLAHVPAEQGLAVAVVMRALDVVLLVPMGLAYCIDAMRMRRRRDLV